MRERIGAVTDTSDLFISVGIHNRDEAFELSDVEVETLRRAAVERNLPFDEKRRTYLKSELTSYGLVREGYTREEIKELRLASHEVSCYDDGPQAAERLLCVE